MALYRVRSRAGHEILKSAVVFSVDSQKSLKNGALFMFSELFFISKQEKFVRLYATPQVVINNQVCTQNIGRMYECFQIRAKTITLYYIRPIVNKIDFAQK